MKVADYRDLLPLVDAPGVGKVPDGVKMRSLVGKDDGATFAVRIQELEPRNQPPHGLHTHPWEHQFYVVSGEGALLSEQGETRLTPGLVGFIPGGEPHTFVNRGKGSFVFVDSIPAVWEFAVDNRRSYDHGA
jgi:quercetin dioxygenase-like cupin family protein